MIYYLLCLGIVFFYLTISYMLGDLFLHMVSSEEQSVSYRVLLGFFCYYFLFQLMAIPLKLTLQPLSLLTKLWWIFILAVMLLFSFLRRKTFPICFATVSAICLVLPAGLKYTAHILLISMLNPPPLY